MDLQSYLARKFLSGKARSWLTSSLTWMAVLGVLISVMAFIVVEAVMSGFSEDLQEKILGFSSHLTLTLQPESDADAIFAKVVANPDVRHVQSFREGEAVLRTEEEESQGVRIRGVDPHHPPQLENLRVTFEEGEDWQSLEGTEAELPGILLGEQLANNLGVLPILRERIELIYPFGEIGPTGEVEPNLRAFRVIGVFRSGYYEYDSKYALTALDQAGRLFGEHAALQLGVFLKNPFQARELASRFQGLMGVARVQAWQDQHRRLFSALRLERVGMGLVLGLMITLASFNILSLMMMVVYERRRDIAVLKALGLSKRGVAGIFYRTGLWIGALGGILGLILGGGLSWGLERAHLPLPSSYYLEALPVRLEWYILGGAFAVALILSLVATLFPAREGKDFRVVEALRYE